MIKRLKRAILLGLSVVMLLSINQPVLAATNYVLIGGKLNGGVGNYGYNPRHYFITSSASSYKANVDSAMESWIRTTSRLGVTTPIYYEKVTVQKNSTMDIYAVSEPYLYANAYTEFMKSGNNVDPSKVNWGWNKISINKPYFTNLSSKSERDGVMAHEMGHCFGLDENNSNKYSIMCQSAYGRSVTKSQKCDLKGINALY